MTGAETASVRLALLRAMAAEMNIWMFDFAQTTHAIAKGLLDGTLTDAVIAAYPPGGEYPETLSRAIAHQVGLVYVDEEPVYSSGWLLNVGAEAVGNGVQALLAIPAGDVGVADTTDGGVWQFYAENLEEHGLTIAQVRDHMRGLDLTRAARLIVDSNAVLIGDTR